MGCNGGLMGSIVIGKHTLESLTTWMYADPFVVYREYIQNAADSIDGAIECGVLKREDNYIDVRIAPFENKIIIEDNGVGIIADEAEKTLISIGNSKKASDNSRGFRGIGRLAGLGYCAKLIFETSAYGENEGARVTIDAQKLAERLSLDEKDDISAKEVLEQIYSFEKYKEKEKKHYFKVTMEGVDQDSHLCVRSSVYDYLSQNVPVPYDNEKFAWGQEVKNRLKADGYIIPEYNINLTCSGETTPVVKPLTDYFSLDKSGNTIDKIRNIRSVQFINEEGVVSAYGWIADTSYLGSIYDKRIKGLRIRKGNILIGDEQTLNVAFKDARFNGWSIGEIFVIDPKLIPNARRDNFEKTPAYFIFMEQIRNMAAGITKEIRKASIKRNQELAQTIKTTQSISKEASAIVDSEGIDPLRTVSLKKRLIETKNALEKVSSNDEMDLYNKEIAFDELDMLMGKIQGITAYKALNVSHGINNNEKRTLEKVFDVIVSTHPDEAEEMIDAILKVFSSDH